MRTIRKNSDITQIVIHHTQDPLGDSGKNLNKEYTQSGKFGAPYDIHINSNGSIDLTPQWIYAVKPTQYTQNVSIFQISKYDKHYLAAIGDTSSLQLTAIHVAIIGDFNEYFPTQQQLNSAIAVLSKLSKDYSIDLNKDLVYHNEVAILSCPGNNFIAKADLVRACNITLLPDFSIQNNSIDKVINPIALNFTGQNVTVLRVGDTVNILYYYSQTPQPQPVSEDDSLVVTVDACCC